MKALSLVLPSAGTNPSRMMASTNWGYGNDRGPWASHPNKKSECIPPSFPLLGMYRSARSPSCEGTPFFCECRAENEKGRLNEPSHWTPGGASFNVNGADIDGGVPDVHTKGHHATVAAIGLSALALTQPTTAHAETLRWKCDYTSIASPTGLAAGKFSLEFAADTITGKAVMIGNDGMADVAVVSGNQGITFQETLGSGAVQTTTITKDGSSVHSRHTMMSGKLIPSQYYGTCK